MASITARVRQRAHGITVAGLVLVLAVVVFANSWGTFTTDIKPEVYLAPGRMLREYVSAWTFSPYLGGPNFNAGLTPVVAVTGLLSALGMSPELAFKTFHLALWLVAASGASALGRRLDPAMGRRGGLVVAIVYVANPYAVTAGATLAILLPLAWLPWQLLCLVRASQEPHRWRWPALFGLTFFLMGGLNAGVVPVLGLLALVPTMMYCRREFGLSWRQVSMVVTRCAVFVVWVSLYWLVPAVSAAATGQAIVQGSESFDGIANVSSFAEVLRGLGLWPLYGSNGPTPWVANHAIYLSSILLVMVTFVAAALALMSLADVPRRLARYLTALVVMSAVVMVGLYPPQSPSPFGRALSTAFDTLPVLSAFRTTNKIGAVLALAFALAAGMVLRSWLARLDRPSSRRLLIGAGGALVVVVALPAFIGRLYISPLEIPDYWDQAASTLDADGDPQSRVAVLPGVVNPNYRWTEQRPDDILNSLFDRPTFTSTTTPNTSAEAVNFTAAMDDTFQSATAQGPVTSMFARYLGAGDVLLRHDLVWEDEGGARPSVTQQVVNDDSGLFPEGNFGEPGENVGSPTVAPDGFDELAVPPLQQYRVSRAPLPVRAESAEDSLVVAGDAWSVPAMTRRGLLATAPAFRYAQDLDDTDWDDALGAGHRLTLTDTNRRRAAITNRLVNGQGPLLQASDPLPAGSRTLGVDPEDQTVLRVDGGAVTASQRGFAFFDTPWGTGENAFDGDPDTAWIFGDFRRGAGQHVQVDLDEPQSVSQIVLSEAVRGPVRIGRVTVDAGGVSRTATLDADGTTTIDLGVPIATSVRVTIDSLTGEGFNAVAIAEIEVPGVQVRRVAELPRTFDLAYQGWTAERRQEFSDTPLDVLLTRVQGGAGADDDEESNLRRTFSLPDERTFSMDARVRLDDDAEALYDVVEGVEPGATSSGRWFDQPRWRASGAFDADPDTGWAPDVVDGASITLAAPSRELGTVTFTQRALPGATETSWARRVAIESDGRRIAVADVDPGANSIALGAAGETVTVGDLTLEIVESDPSGAQISSPLITRIGAGVTLDRDPDPSDCLSVGTVDGRDLAMRPVDAASPEGSQWSSCGADSQMSAGIHEVEAARAGVLVDTLDLTDVRDAVPVSTATPELTYERGFGASMTVRVAANEAPYLLVIGEGFDPRWTASLDGRDLGTPVASDGYATSWRVEPGQGGVITVRFAPQTATNAALASTGVGVLLAGAIGLTPWARRRSVRIDRAGGWANDRAAAIALPPWSSRLGSMVPARPAWTRRLTTGLGGWAVLAAVAGALGSWPGLGAGLALGLLHLVAARRGVTIPPVWLVRGGAALVVLAGVVFVVTTGGLRGPVSPTLVAAHPWPNGCAAAGLVAVVVGVWRDPSTSRRDEEPRYE